MAAGRKTGGRKRGVPNRRTTAKQVAETLIEAGETPLEFLTSIYRDDLADIELRVEAAKAAAPYVHARLASIDLSNKDGQPLVVEIVRYGADQAPE